MSILLCDNLTRFQRIRAAATAAQLAEQQANAASEFQSAPVLWAKFDVAVVTLLGLILSPDGAAALDAIEVQIGRSTNRGQA